MTSQIDTVRAAYQDFMRAKYPDQEPPHGEFKFFDPHDAVPDKGLGFLPLNRKIMVQKDKDFGLLTGLKFAATAKRKPPQRGVYMAIGPAWMYLAPTLGEAVALFRELQDEIELKVA